MNARLLAVARAAVLPVLLLVLWELLARANRIPVALTSQPSTIAQAFVASVADGSLALATAQTLFPAFVGWVCGNAIGIAAGVAIGTIPRLRDAVGPAIDVFRSVPPVVMIPVALLALGLGPKLEIVMVTFTVVWPVAILTAAAVRSVDGRLIEVARALRFDPLQRVIRFVLPAAAPSIFVALRLATGIALVIAVTTEIIANPSGLGYGITLASTTLRPDIMFADLLWLAVIGFALNALFDVVQHRAFGWVR
jgi:ABC-type nitrate/sulfonate/bicarbonate transport system permease component